jgi:hypothetical protein
MAQALKIALFTLRQSLGRQWPAGSATAACGDELMQLVDEQNNCPFDFSISLRTALRRSSNSPRYFAPDSSSRERTNAHPPGSKELTFDL